MRCNIYVFSVKISVSECLSVKWLCIVLKNETFGKFSLIQITYEFSFTLGRCFNK